MCLLKTQIRSQGKTHWVAKGSQILCFTVLPNTVKPVLSGHSKIDKTKILMTNGSLMMVERIAECSPWSILQYFGPALSDNWPWKPIFGLLFEWPLKTGFTVDHKGKIFPFLKFCWLENKNNANLIVPQPCATLPLSLNFQQVHYCYLLLAISSS